MTRNQTPEEALRKIHADLATTEESIEKTRQRYLRESSVAPLRVFGCVSFTSSFVVWFFLRLRSSQPP